MLFRCLRLGLVSLLLMPLARTSAGGSLDAQQAIRALVESHSAQQEGEAVGLLEALVAHVRAGDYRLVRPGPSAETGERQAELAQAGCIEAVAAVLNRPSPRQRTLGAELVHLLTTNNPANRAQLGAAGVIPNLVRMVEAGALSGAEDEVVRGSEEAAEALWILAFNGGANHEGFAAHGAALALAQLAMHSPSAKGKMWAGAAMGNLVAAYGNVPGEASESARKMLAEWPGLVEALVGMVARGPVQHGEDWPSQAHKETRFAESTVAWGAGQALKNLALSPAAQGPIREAKGVRALCRLKQSPDWLEKMKAELTLGNLGEGCSEL